MAKLTYPAFMRSFCFLHNLTLLLRQPQHAAVMPYPVFNNHMSHETKERVPEMQPEE